MKKSRQRQGAIHRLFLTQRREDAKDAKEEKRKGVREHTVKFHAYLAYNNLFFFACLAPLRLGEENWE